MNPYRFLGLCALGYVALIGIFGSNTSTPTTTSTTAAPIIEYAPVTTWETVPPSTTTTTTTATAEPTTTLPQLVDYDTPCQEWVDEALAAGWPADRQIITRLMGVVWKESRCQPHVVNPRSPDHGLTQVNDIHRAYVEQIFGEPFEIAMSDPIKNLHFAWLLYSEREADGLCGWQPWSLPC